MYTKVVFESAKEFFEACRQRKVGNGSRTFVPAAVYVVFDGDALPFLSGEGAENFGLSDDISQDEMIEEAFCIASSKVHLT